MSNIDKFITSNLIKELDNKAAEVVSGGQNTTQGLVQIGDDDPIRIDPDPDETARFDLTTGVVEFIPVK